ncbi:MAG: ISNCY family transposase [Bacteroidetes bacterium]|nr:ISNCY family transposase [Bacteroidota bacterium]
MVKFFRDTVCSFPDNRTGSNKIYSIEDATLGAFSVFFTQSPSFLSFQTAMQQKKGKNNAQSLFGILNIPCHNQINNLLDTVAPTYVYPVFSYIFNGLKDTGHIDAFKSYNGNLLIALDGTLYFSSKSIHCENCNQKHHKNGTTTYSHTVITPVVVAPDNNKVISLQPEFITPQDGHKKQDCENAAAKRWIRQYASLYKDLGISVLGDDLYCKQPLCELMLEEQLDFILVCKPDSHKTLYQYVEELEAMGTVETVIEKRWTGKIHQIDTYRFAQQLPLRDSEDALNVNWCELITTLPDGEIIYKNAFATNFKITKNNVAQIVEDGRTRWKVENENNNVLKTKGYHLKHNFGHGKKHLSTLMLTLNLLAFLFHTVLEITDKKYKLIRDELPTRKTFFDDIRALTKYMYFESWDSLLIFMIRGLELDPPDTS